MTAASRSRPDGGLVPRRLLIDAAILAVLLVAGGLCGIGARLWIGGLKAQRVQLERCVRTSRQPHADEDAPSALRRLDADVPACMSAAGYERELDDRHCSPAFWQGNVFCYRPKSSFGRLIYRLEAASAEKRTDDGSNREPSGREGR